MFYPDFYGGSFALCPDSVDFEYHQIVNIYKDANAYYIDKGWTKVERPSERRPDGNIEGMMKDENWFELVVGDKSRSGGQWDIWEATYSPVGPDGYPKRLWNKETGVIDKSVAEQWKKYDLLDILRTNWSTLGPKLGGQAALLRRRHGYVLPERRGREAERVSYQRLNNPKFTGEVVFQRRAPHCWGPRGAELLQKLEAQVEKGAPAGHREELEVLEGRVAQSRLGESLTRSWNLEALDKPGHRHVEHAGCGGCRGATARGSGSGTCLRRSCPVRSVAIGYSRLTERFIRRKRDAGIAMARESTFSTRDCPSPSASTRRLNTRTRSYFA